MGELLKKAGEILKKAGKSELRIIPGNSKKGGGKFLKKVVEIPKGGKCFFSHVPKI